MIQSTTGFSSPLFFSKIFQLAVGAGAALGDLKDALHVGVGAEDIRGLGDELHELLGQLLERTLLAHADAIR